MGREVSRRKITWEGGLYFNRPTVFTHWCDRNLLPLCNLVTRCRFCPHVQAGDIYSTNHRLGQPLARKAEKRRCMHHPAMTEIKGGMSAKNKS